MQSEEAEHVIAVTVGLLSHAVAGVAFWVGAAYLAPADAGLEALRHGLSSGLAAEVALLLGVGITGVVLSVRGRPDLATRVWLGWGSGAAAAVAVGCCLGQLS